jgi:beta-alanine degradation protein BauB
MVRGMNDERELGPVGTKVVFENERVRVWVLRLAPGERSAVHQHDLDHLLIQIRGDRIAVAPEADAKGPNRDYMEAEVIPGMVAHVPKGGIETAINVGVEPYYEVIVELKETTAKR